MRVEGEDVLEFVSIPIFDSLVFAAREEIVRIGYKLHRHDGIVMGKEGFVAVAEVETPYLDVLIR